MSGVAAGLASLIGAGVNAGVNYYNRQQDLSLLKYQNEWNSPVNQMKRGMAAGINPNAIAQGISGAAAFGNMAQGDASTVSNGLPSDLGTQLGNSYNSALQASLTKASIENVKEKTRGEKLENDYSDTTFDSRVQQCLNEGVITESEAKNARLMAEKYPEMLDLSIEQQRENINKTRKEMDKLDKDMDKIEQDIKESDKRIEHLEQQIKTEKSAAALNYANVALTNERKRNQELLNSKQEMENRREELTGSASGVTAAYFDIEKQDGKEAADKWLEENNAVVEKVVKNSSKASAEGSQEVYDNTPQGQLKRMYQDKMDKEIAELREAQSRVKQGSFEYRNLERDINRIMRKYRNKIRRVDKGSSVGASAFGFGLNGGG